MTVLAADVSSRIAAPPMKHVQLTRNVRAKNASSERRGNVPPYSAKRR